MSSMDLPKMSTVRPFLKSSSSSDHSFSNFLDQKFSQDAPNLVWVSDITYIRASAKWYYLCVVIDLFSRKVVGWNLSNKPDADLVIAAFMDAWHKRNINFGLMFHSDRGSQYTAFSFRKLLDSLNVVQSFSKKGYPFDNAVCESFFKYLKKERTNRNSYHSFEELRLDLFDYIESFYNNRRPHGSLGYLTPNQMEFNYWNLNN